MDWDTLGSDPEGMDRMQGRSRMAAGLLAAVALGVGVGLGVAGGAKAAWAGQPAPIKQKVKLVINVAGTTPSVGAELLIKPAHPACKFKPITYAVKQDRIEDIPPIEVESLSADRDCSFALVLKEPGLPDKLFRRSLQLDAPTGGAAAEKVQTLRCYISSNMIAAKVAAPRPTPVAAKPAADPARKR